MFEKKGGIALTLCINFNFPNSKDVDKPNLLKKRMTWRHPDCQTFPMAWYADVKQSTIWPHVDHKTLPTVRHVQTTPNVVLWPYNPQSAHTNKFTRGFFGIVLKLIGTRLLVGHQVLSAICMSPKTGRIQIALLKTQSRASQTMTSI